jgi:hypothetical protein
MGKPWSDHLSTLMVIRGLGMICHRWGKFDEAETMLKRALVGYEKGLELGHLGTPRVVYILAILYCG